MYAFASSLYWANSKNLTVKRNYENSAKKVCLNRQSAPPVNGARPLGWVRSPGNSANIVGQFAGRIEPSIATYPAKLLKTSPPH
jgi:hypothetical protein